MTKINHESPVVRETDSLYKNKPIVIELHCGYIVFRVKGMQKFRASVSYEGAFQRALQSEASAGRVAEGGREAPQGEPRSDQD